MHVVDMASSVRERAIEDQREWVEYKDYAHLIGVNGIDFPKINGGVVATGPKGQIDNGTVDLDSLDFEFAGSPKEVQYGGAKKVNPWIFSKFSQAIDYVLGMFAGGIRVSIAGWTAAIEEWMSTTMHMLSGTTGDNIYTIEDIIFNKIPILDVDIFSDMAGGERVNDNSVAGVLRRTVAEWFVLVRNIIAVVLAILLVYSGLRMAISTVAEEKANYKQYLVGWLKSIILLFFVTYGFILILNINGELVNVFSNANSQENLIYETIRTRANDTRFSIGITGLLMYIALIYMFIRFTWVYAKRFITIIILTIISPVVIGKYAYDCARGRKSTTFSNFLYLYASNVLIQSIHALLYTSLVSIALDWALKNITGFILALAFMSFMLKSDKIVLKLFKINNNAVNIRRSFNKKEELTGVYYGYGMYKLDKTSDKGLIERTKRNVASKETTATNDEISAVSTLPQNKVEELENKNTTEEFKDKSEKLNDEIYKTKTKLGRQFLDLDKDDKHLEKENNVNQKLVLKITPRRKVTSDKFVKQTIKLKKVERKERKETKERFTSKFKYIASETKGEKGSVLAVSAIAFNKNNGLTLTQSKVSKINEDSKQDKFKHLAATQRTEHVTSYDNYGNTAKEQEKNEKNKEGLDSLVFFVMKSNEAMDKLEEELEKYKDPMEKEQAKDTMKQVINIKADVNKVKDYVDKYMEDNLIPDISKMNDTELENMAIQVSNDIGKKSNLDEEKTKNITNEVVKNIKNVEINDSNRFAQIVNSSAVTANVDKKFVNIAQEINKIKQAEISVRTASEIANSDDDIEVVDINKFIDNL